MKSRFCEISTRLGMAIALVLSVSACSEKSAPLGFVPPPTEVNVVTIQEQPVVITTQLPGRVAPVRTAQVRARVPGILLEQTFKEGEDVKEGDVLFRIDPAVYEAQFESAKANLEREEANLYHADTVYKRMKELLDVNTVSRQDYDNAYAAFKQAQAGVAVAKASLESARLNLEYATVKAPISGRIGRAYVTEGALVGQGEVTLLAIINQLDPIYVNFNQSASQIAHFRNQIAEGVFDKAVEEAKELTVFTDGDTRYSKQGKLLFAEVSVDQTTGQLALRGEFPNPDIVLLPGAYVRVEMAQAKTDKGILVPQQAVQFDAGGDSYVLVVGKNNQVERKTIKIPYSVGEQWFVSEGLAVGDRVIVDGLQKTGVGATVAPVEKTSDTAAPVAGVKQ
jgi:membrane fusion protein (multidrug efflux system)